MFNGGNPPVTKPQLLSLLSKPHHGGILTGGNMLVSHGDDGDDDSPEELGGVRSGSTSCLFQLPIILALGRNYF